MSDIIGPRNWLLSHPIRWANGLWWWGERQERPIVRRYAELLQDTLVSWEKPNMDGPRLRREPVSHAEFSRFVQEAQEQRARADRFEAGIVHVLGDHDHGSDDQSGCHTYLEAMLMGGEGHG